MLPITCLAKPFSRDSLVGQLQTVFMSVRHFGIFGIWNGEQKVKDSDRLELDWLLKCKLEELIASVRPMSAKNCEQIVRATLDRIGGPSFEQLLMRIGRNDGSEGRATNSDEYYFAIRDLVPHVPPEND